MGWSQTLVDWHQNHPVDEAERLRNDLIFQNYQGNRNPFIDHPEWVMLIFNSDIR
jgi:endonuclease I